MPQRRASFLDLNGPWSYTADPGECGEDKGFYLPEYADADWPVMNLPANWHLAGLKDYSGAVWFRRHVRLPADAEGQRLWLRFKGVDYRASVWVNGVLVGEHEGYFQPFEFDISAVALFGEENVITVRVDSPREEPGRVWPHRKTLIKGIFNHHDCRPGAWDLELGQSQNTGGIWNDVGLVLARGVRILSARVAPQLLSDGRAAVRMTLAVENLHLAPVRARLELAIKPENFEGADISGQEDFRLSPGVNELVRVRVVEEPALWWTWDQGPQNLYRLEARATLLSYGDADELATVFGLRSISLDEQRQWRINGRRFFVRGTNIIPTQWLSEYTGELVARDVELLRQANLNAVRVHAHVNRREFYEACDRAGILVWQDFALQWSYEESDEFRTRAVRQIRDMVHTFYNHPSIGLWCCHNEPAGNRQTLDLLLEQAVREEDATRPVLPASDFHDHPYPGWYYGHVAEFSGLPGKPLATEFGAQALPSVEALERMFGGAEAAWPPDWQKWKYHDFQYDQTVNVAGVKVPGVPGQGSMEDRGEGGTHEDGGGGAGADERARGGREVLAEFVEASQAYQAKLIKTAIGHYRRAKYRPMGGFFQFMFVDCWPAITWSVLDYWRQPKKGYFALREACQPVWVTVPLPREKVARGASLDGVEVWVVNDLPRAFVGAVLSAEVHALSQSETRTQGPGQAGPGPLLQAKALVDIAADSAAPVWRVHGWSIPNDVALGAYRASFTLTAADGTVLSRTAEEFTVVEDLTPYRAIF